MSTITPGGILAPSQDTAVAAVTDVDAVRDVLQRRGVSVADVSTFIGPQIVSYAVELDRGDDPKKVERAADSLALALGAPVRYAGVQGDRVIVEVNRAERAAVPLADLMESELPGNLPAHVVPVGRDASNGKPMFLTLPSLPHLLVAGTTGSGKSTFVTAMLTALMMRNSPDRIRFVLIDPKRVELSMFEDSPHLLEPVVKGVADATSALRRVVALMDDRYAMFEGSVKDITAYNALHKDKPLPAVVVVVDELADLMMQAGKVTEGYVVRLAQLGRAAGVHMVLATQRPDRKTFTPLILSNVPARVAFAVQSHHDSTVALGKTGAEKLAGGGDGLFKSPSSLGAVTRFQSAFVSTADARRVTSWWRRERPAAVEPEPEVVPVDDTQATRAAQARADLDALWSDAEKSDCVPSEILGDAGITPEVLDALAESLTERIGAGVLEYITKNVTKEDS